MASNLRWEESAIERYGLTARARVYFQRSNFEARVFPFSEDLEAETGNQLL